MCALVLRCPFHPRKSSSARASLRTHRVVFAAFSDQPSWMAATAAVATIAMTPFVRLWALLDSSVP